MIGGSMPRYATGFLLAAAMAAVLGFGMDKGSAATIAQISFFTFLCLSACALMGCKRA
jgi:uncharacterized membrane protein YtjA (UPF0391 family)